MIRLLRLCLPLALALNTGCSLVYSRSPTTAQWKAVESGTWNPTMKCVSAGNQATLDALGAAGSLLLGFLFLNASEDWLFGDVYQMNAITSFAGAVGLGVSSYYGYQTNEECGRFDAAVQARYGRRLYAPWPAQPGPLAPGGTLPAPQAPVAPPSQPGSTPAPQR